MVSASMFCCLQKTGQKCAADIGRDAKFKPIHCEMDCFLIFRFRGKLNLDDAVLGGGNRRKIRSRKARNILGRNDGSQDFSFPTVICSEIQSSFLAPFFDAHTAGAAFDDPLFPYGHLLGILDVVDCHGSTSGCMDSCGFALIHAY